MSGNFFFIRYRILTHFILKKMNIYGVNIYRVSQKNLPIYVHIPEIAILY